MPAVLSRKRFCVFTARYGDGARSHFCGELNTKMAEAALHLHSHLEDRGGDHLGRLYKRSDIDVFIFAVEAFAGRAKDGRKTRFLKGRRQQILDVDCLLSSGSTKEFRFTEGIRTMV